MKAMTYMGRVYEVDKAKTCPYCTKFKTLPNRDLAGRQVVEVSNPIFMVKRTNSQTGAKFWGCPKFPKCNWTESIPDVGKTPNGYWLQDEYDASDEDFRDGCPNC